MYVIFNNKNRACFQRRLIFYIIISLIIIFFDVKFNILFKIQNYISYSSFFLHYVQEISSQWIKSITYSLHNSQKLILENNILKEKLCIANSKLLLTEYYKQENKKLRELLSSPTFNHEKKILAQVISNKINSYTARITINKGTDNGVYIGQAVINEKGIIGQIISTNKLTSQVLLICDISHALPVQVLRNNIRMILKGNGYNNYLKSKNPSNNHIQIGDILITSGLAGRFPVGYPVAIVSAIDTNYKTGFKIIQASSIAKLNHLSYLLLLTNMKNDIQQPLSADITFKIFHKRLNLSTIKK